MGTRHTYEIWHPVGKLTNPLCYTDLQFVRVATIKAINLNQAFLISQDFNEDYEAFGTRSTSVGDIIVRINEGSADEAFMVRGTGFKQVALPNRARVVYDTLVQMAGRNY